MIRFLLALITCSGLLVGFALYQRHLWRVEEQRRRSLMRMAVTITVDTQAFTDAVRSMGIAVQQAMDAMVLFGNAIPLSLTGYRPDAWLSEDAQVVRWDDIDAEDRLDAIDDLLA